MESRYTFELSNRFRSKSILGECAEKNEIFGMEYVSRPFRELPIVVPIRYEHISPIGIVVRVQFL